MLQRYIKILTEVCSIVSEIGIDTNIKVIVVSLTTLTMLTTARGRSPRAVVSFPGR